MYLISCLFAEQSEQIGQIFVLIIMHILGANFQRTHPKNLEKFHVFVTGVFAVERTANVETIVGFHRFDLLPVLD